MHRERCGQRCRRRCRHDSACKQGIVLGQTLAPCCLLERRAKHTPHAMPGLLLAASLRNQAVVPGRCLAAACMLR